jgi:hypothetical protein
MCPFGVIYHIMPFGHDVMQCEGRLYLFSEFVVFYSNYMGLGTTEKIRLDQIIDLKKSKKGGVPHPPPVRMVLHCCRPLKPAGGEARRGYLAQPCERTGCGRE